MTVTEMVQPEAGTGVGEFYVRNMRLLWGQDARLAMAIDSLASGAVVEGAKDGNFTVKVGGGSGVYLHSRYRPVQEAETWAGSQKCDDKYVVIVSGFGLGYHVKALFDRMPGDAIIVVGEPNLGVL